MEAFIVVAIATLAFSCGLLFVRLVMDPCLMGLIFSAHYHSIKESNTHKTQSGFKSFMLVFAIIALASAAIVFKSSFMIPILLITGSLMGLVWSFASYQADGNAQQLQAKQED
jgi:hypothetical protein